ncbi:MAG TPA: hypothetical protein VHA34_02510, partial [Actinomycetes bacterium]|nr:hypothetical protein [Actinomycetes bacterium]
VEAGDQPPEGRLAPDRLEEGRRLGHAPMMPSPGGRGLRHPTISQKMTIRENRGMRAPRMTGYL